MRGLLWKTRVSVFTPLASTEVVISELSGPGRVVLLAIEVLAFKLAFAFAFSLVLQPALAAASVARANPIKSLLLTFLYPLNR
jgi:hypothetical protein